MKTAEDFVAFGRASMDALVKSSHIWTIGMQDLSKQVAASAQASFDESLTVFKAFSALNTPKDALDMQANMARVGLEKAVSETGKLTDASVKLAEQAMAPLTAQMNLVAEKFAKVG
ncbi:MAG: phasin family protein [Acetobacteraceae bacterium]|nr:phasin family protein [Acetobacteraceae bacterium]